MPRAYFLAGSLAAALDYPESLEQPVISLMGLERSVSADARVAATIRIDEAASGRYVVRCGDDIVAGDLLSGNAIMTAWREAVMAVADGFPQPSVVLHAASLERNGSGVLIPGRSGRGKSSLTAWLTQEGYQQLSDEITILLPDGDIHAVYGPLFIRADVWPLAEKLGLRSAQVELEGGARLLQAPSRDGAQGWPLPCRLILLPAFSRSKLPAIEVLPPARATMALMEQNHSARGVGDGGLQLALAAAAQAVTLRLTYGSYDEINGLLQPILDQALNSGAEGIPDLLARTNDALLARRASAASPSPSTPEGMAPGTTVPPFPVATPRRDVKPRLTIGMATYDDYHGVYFTVQALRLYHADVMAETEIIVIDNHPSGEAAPLLKKMDGEAPNYRYIPYTEKSGTAASREHLFAEASGDFVMCVDCHVLLVPGALSRLMAYIDANPMSSDLLQGPLLYDDQRSISTHWQPKWNDGMFGVWETDKRALDMNAEPFEIPMVGLGIFACRRDAWLHFNPEFRGFGGEEGYIHEKFRQAGHRTLCLPFLRWMHRFGRPGGTPYPNIWEDRIHNYYVGHRELGLDTGPMEAHFAQHLGAENFARMRQQVGFGPKPLETA